MKTKVNSLQIHSQATTAYRIREETVDGKKYVIVPVVMMVEGVHEGSSGAMLHTADELGRFPDSYNGIPVTINHPQDTQGHFISANSPGARNEHVGRVYNTRMEGTKLKADAYLDPQKLAAIAPNALAAVMNGNALEVSIGVFTDMETVAGEWNGETYESIARNHRPDHLALLPGGTGACSWKDGCGIRNNEKKKGGGSMEKDLEKTLKDVSLKGFALSLIANAQGFRETMEALQTKLNAMDNDVRVYYLQEVYEDHYIFSVRNRESGAEKFYRQKYSVNDAGELDTPDEPEEVKRSVEYVALENELSRTKFNNNTKQKEDKTMTTEKKTPCCLAKVEQLIANKQSRFTEEDKEWLLAQDEVTLDKLLPKEPEKTKEEPQVNQEIAMQVLRESISKPEEFMKLLPDEIRDQVQEGLRLHKEQRSTMVQAIIANSAEGTWDEKELNEMNTDLLRKLHRSVSKPDFSANGGNPPATPKVNDEILVPGGIKLEEKSK